jgi:hypothetical protein
MQIGAVKVHQQASKNKYESPKASKECHISMQIATPQAALEKQ